jgi:SAM-dependent methyltransferase
MKRVTEPELMDDAEQARAYHEADFSVAHGERVAIFRQMFPGLEPDGAVLDLGCGSGDVLLRFARAFPRARFTGVDGSQPMLELAAGELRRHADLQRRVQLWRAILPSSELPQADWQLVMSHSLLHQLHQPQVLWRTIREAAPPGCAVFVADLRRPATAADAARIVAERSAGEPDVLQQDFFNSLCAAFEPAEVCAQLDAAGLAHLCVEPVGDIHLVVYGTMAGAGSGV